jgi:hypothetical protein
MTLLLIAVVPCLKSWAASLFSEGNKATADYKRLVRTLRLLNFYLRLVVRFLIFFGFVFLFILTFAHKVRRF